MRVGSETSAFGPPWHAWVLLASVLGFAWSAFPSTESLDNEATLDLFTRRIFPNRISLAALGVIRLLMALVGWCTTIIATTSKEGITIHTTYRPTSKLKKTVIKIRGLKALCPFTMWCWILMTVSFSLDATICFHVYFGSGNEISPVLLRSALIMWELSAPFALLVSAVVRYAIWPVSLANGRSHNLKMAPLLAMHNVNSIFVLVERFLLGGLPVHREHLAFIVAYGTIYIAFTWSMVYCYAPKENGPQVLYWFLDFTLGSKTTAALAALLLVFLFSYGFFARFGAVIEILGGGISTHALVVVGVSSVVCRFRD